MLNMNSRKMQANLEEFNLMMAVVNAADELATLVIRGGLDANKAALRVARTIDDLKRAQLKRLEK